MGALILGFLGAFFGGFLGYKHEWPGVMVLAFTMGGFAAGYGAGFMLILHSIGTL